MMVMAMTGKVLFLMTSFDGGNLAALGVWRVVRMIYTISHGIPKEVGQ